MISILFTLENNGESTIDLVTNKFDENSTDVYAIQLELLLGGSYTPTIKEYLNETLEGRQILAAWNTLLKKSKPVVEPKNFVKYHFGGKNAKET